MGKIALTVDTPLVNEKFEVLEASKDFLEKTQDERTNFIATILVKDMSMAPTAMFFALRKRINIEFCVKLNNFKGSDFIYSFLKSSHIKEIEYE